MSDFAQGLAALWFLVGVCVGLASTYSLDGGEAVAFAVFWPITVPVWLLINLYRLGKRGYRELVP